MLQYPEKQEPTLENPGFVLQSLVDYTQTPDLKTTLEKIHIARVADVGTGWSFHNLLLIKSILNLQPEQLLSIDPDYIEFPPPYKDRFTIIPHPIEDVAKTYKNTVDLVLCVGVTSFGSTIIDEAARPIHRAIASLLNRQNPQSLAVLSTKFPESIFPFTARELAESGLQVVFSKPSTHPDESDIALFKHMFPHVTQSDINCLYVCRKS